MRMRLSVPVVRRIYHRYPSDCQSEWRGQFPSPWVSTRRCPRPRATPLGSARGRRLCAAAAGARRPAQRAPSKETPWVGGGGQSPYRWQAKLGVSARHLAACAAEGPEIRTFVAPHHLGHHHRASGGPGHAPPPTAVLRGRSPQRGGWPATHSPPYPVPRAPPPRSTGPGPAPTPATSATPTPSGFRRSRSGARTCARGAFQRWRAA